MKRFQLLMLIAIAIIGTIELTSCSSAFQPSKHLEIPLKTLSSSSKSTLNDLEKPVRLVVTSKVDEADVIKYSGDNKLSKLFTPSSYTFTPSIQSFTEKATRRVMEDLGFKVSSSADYTLYIDVTDITYKITSSKSGRKHKALIEPSARLTYRLVNEAGETIVPAKSVSVTVPPEEVNAFAIIDANCGTTIATSYYYALDKIDWNRIADCLRVAATPKQEKNARVTGAGDTALEHTVIRWYIQSKPQGADVSWRVISSTPDVSNTNSTYVGTTPYESTEAFDIRGLTYNNSGNVQIEVSCEKDGYLPQRKRFNLRQAIDQKEISAKFNLVKDED